MKAGPSFTVPLEQRSSWGRGLQFFPPSWRVSLAAQPSDPHCRQMHTEDTLQPAKNSSLGERGPLQPPPPLCHSARLSNGCFSLPAGLEQPKLLLQQGSGAAGRRKATGSRASLLQSGKQEKLENANDTAFTGYLQTFPSRRKGMCKHTAALRIPCQSTQQPLLRTVQPGPKPNGQKKMGVYMMYPIHQNDNCRVPWENEFHLLQSIFRYHDSKH